MTETAEGFMNKILDLDEDFGGEVKKFKASRGMGADAASSLNDAKLNLERSQEHDAQAKQHQGEAASNKAQGDRVASTLHSGAADHHQALSAIHTNLASRHLQKSKAAQNLGEGLDEAFGLRTMDPENLYRSSDYDMSRKQNYDVRHQRHGQSATVADMQRIANEVFAKHRCGVTLIRVLQNNGFVVAAVLTGGNYQGTAFPSVPALEADLIKAVRDEIPHAIVDLIDQGDIVGDSPGQYRKRAYFRFRLNDLHRGDLGGP
jgi:hypothetical protein